MRDNALWTMQWRLIGLTEKLQKGYHLESDASRMVVRDLLYNVGGLQDEMDEEELEFYKLAKKAYDEKTTFEGNGIAKEKYQQDAVVENDSNSDNLSD